MVLFGKVKYYKPRIAFVQTKFSCWKSLKTGLQENLDTFIQNQENIPVVWLLWPFVTYFVPSTLLWTRVQYSRQTYSSGFCLCQVHLATFWNRFGQRRGSDYASLHGLILRANQLYRCLNLKTLSTQYYWGWESNLFQLFAWQTGLHDQYFPYSLLPETLSKTFLPSLRLFWHIFTLALLVACSGSLPN
jgi:hypothetical protein